MSRPAATRKRAYAFCLIPALAVVAVTLLILTPAHHERAIAASTQLESTARSVTPAQKQKLQASFAALPLAFEQNQGQSDPQVKYLARGNGYQLFLTNQDAVFSFSSRSSNDLKPRHSLAGFHKQPSQMQRDSVSVVRMQLLNSNAAIPQGTDPLAGKTNYYIGNDPKKWHTGVPQFGRIAYKNVYPGIDLAYYGQQSKLEFDFIVAPQSNPAPIDLAFSGVRSVATDDSGNLKVSSTAGDVLLHKPVAYQNLNGTRQPVEAHFVLQADNRVRFELGSYDHNRELVIDPTVTYGTYLGGSGEDDGYGIAFDSSGDAYVTGQTASTDFPVVGGLTPGTYGGLFDAFVTKIASDGSSLIYSTFVGGSGNDSGNAIALDASGDAFVAGGSTSMNFPTTASAYQKTLGGTGNTNAFVFELNSSGGTLTYSTYLGGTGIDVAVGIAVDGSGEAYVTGSAGSSNFPILNPLPNQSSFSGTTTGFVTKLNSSGSALVYSTYLGGNTDFASAVAVDSAGNAYVTGGTQNTTFPTTAGVVQTTCGSCSSNLDDAFVSVIKPTGGALVYSTFLGGNNADQGLGIAVDSAANAYITGLTVSSNFPLKSAAYGTFGGGASDAFVAVVNSTGSSLVYSTYLGGSLNDVGTAIAVDVNKNAYVTGQTGSTNFPVTSSATQPTNGGGNDAFVSEFSSTGSLVFSTYLGGSADENTAAAGIGATGAIAVDSAGANIYVTGNTKSDPFPTTSGAKQTTYGGAIDAFVVKYSQATAGQTFALAATPLGPATVAPGGTATSSVTVTSTNGFTGNVTLTCAVSPVVTLGPTCAAATASPSSGATLTVSTTAATALLHHPTKQGFSGIFYALFLPIGGMALAGFGFGSSRSRRSKLFGFLLLGLLLSSLALAPACGGSSSGGGGGGGGGGNAGTPAGSYTIVVSGTATGATETGTVPSLTLTVN